MRLPRIPMSWALLLLVSAASLPGCASKPDLRADYDKSTDFAQFHTFNFVKSPATDTLGYGNLVTQQIETAVRSELEKRGYRLVTENPDLLVNFSGKLQEKADVQSTPSAGYYGYRGYGAWPGYAYGSDVYTVRYTVGTLNVDLVDAKHNQMVWEGVAVGEVTKKARENREAAINKAVAGIFTKFPFRAGVAQPAADGATAAD